MNKPVLVIMAAGMGSRYGGLKQIDAMDEEGHIIMDYSIYDAKRAGFETVVFIIKKENEKIFKEAIGNRIEKFMNVRYVYQELTDIPEGFVIPKDRIKPWGTAHAIYCCRNVIDGPFAVINADDYYGKESFKIIYDYLATHKDDHKYHWSMVGFRLKNTLTENGTVARGICETKDQFLTHIVERTKIMKTETGAAYSENDVEWYELSGDVIVSMNLWGFSYNVIQEIEKGLVSFLEEGLKNNPLKCEYYIPLIVSSMLEKDKATVEVLETSSKWYGVTYKEDKPMVMDAFEKMKNDGLYPRQLWEDNDE